MKKNDLYSPSIIANNIKIYAQQRKIVLKTILADCELGSNTFSHMLHDKSIAFDSLAKIADYLGCSVDYLLGRDAYYNSNNKNNAILEKYNSLNSIGQEKANSYIDDLLGNANYTTSEKVVSLPDSGELVDESSRPAPARTIAAAGASGTKSEPKQKPKKTT